MLGLGLGLAVGLVTSVKQLIHPPLATLSASTGKPEYGVNEDVDFLFTVTAGSAGPVTLPTSTLGILEVVSFERDGSPQQALRGIGAKHTPPLELLILQGLKTLQPGQQVSAVLRGSSGRLNLFTPRESYGDEALYYDITHPGTYTLRFLFRWTMPAEGGAEPAHKRGKVMSLVSNDVSFTVSAQ